MKDYNKVAGAQNAIIVEFNIQNPMIPRAPKMVFDKVDKLLLLDTPQRWDSTFSMVQRFIIMYDVSTDCLVHPD